MTPRNWAVRSWGKCDAPSATISEKKGVEIKKQAEALVAQAAHFSAINDRCDQSALLLQIAVVVCSVSILGQSHKFWWLGMFLGAAGIGVGATAYFI